MALPISTLRSVCAECGTVWEREQSQARCPECTPARDRTAGRIQAESRRGSRQSRGYGAKWERLSKRARQQQPWCSDCGRPDELTADHSPEAWARAAAGLPIRLRDVDVVCVRCNAERGPARGPDAVDRPTIGTSMDELELETEDPCEDDDLDRRIAHAETQGEVAPRSP